MREERLTEGQVRQILRRATELDQDVVDLTPRQLIEVGIEAGISRTAMEAAVEELEAGEVGE